MNELRAIHPQEPRPFRELLVHCEIRAIASRIAAAVSNFFLETVCLTFELYDRGIMWFLLERSKIAALTKPLITNEMDALDRIQITRAVVNIPASERRQAVTLAQRLITSEINGFARKQLIEKIAAVPVNEREQIAALAIQMITNTMDVLERAILIRIVAITPIQERNNVIHHARQIITPDMDALSRGRIIVSITTVPANEREQIVALALQVITNTMNWRKRRFLLKALTDIPTQERNDVIHHALQLITPDMSDAERIRAIRLIAHVPANRRADYVEVLRAGFAEHEIGAQGIDVHEGDRDQRTKTAIELLYTHQENIAADQIHQAKDMFIDYLNTAAIDPSQKQLAQEALLKPKEPAEFFGPLIDEVGFSILGLQIFGADLIGRLWIFASELSGDEQTNAKLSMISALRDSYDFGGRVCNQGKTQRLAVAVLQGRLEGVDIEGQAVNAQFLNLFFLTEAHRNIDTLPRLMEAAHQFCNENPDVNREEFIQEINLYAREQGIV